jgi:urocanate hydratase
MVEIVRKLLCQKPFCPFRVVMKSGQRHDINDPDRMAISRSELHWFAKTDEWIRMRWDEIDVVYEPRSPRH